MFYNFDNNVERICEYIEKYPTFLVYGKEMIGKTTYVKEAIKKSGFFIGKKSGVDIFGNKIMKIKKIDNTPKKIEKDTIYISTMFFSGFQSIKIDYPTKESKEEFLIDKDISDINMEYIISKKISPFMIIKIYLTDYIQELFKSNKKNNIPFSPDNKIKFLIENIILKRNKMDFLNKIKVYDKIRYNKRSNYYFNKFFSIRDLRGKYNGKTTNRKV